MARGVTALWICMAAWFGRGSSSANEPQEATYAIDLAAKRQVIDHFGANDAWSFQKIGAWRDENKARIADLLYSTEKGIGLSYGRFYVGAGINRTTIRNSWRTAESFETEPGTYDWGRLANERWFLRAAKARGVRHFGMTFYSPPGRLTRNGLTNHGTDSTSTTNLKPGQEQQYAKYIVDILDHYRRHPDEAERIEFDRVFPINEPQWEWLTGQEGSRSSNEDTLRLHHALDAALRERKLRTLIGGPESGNIPDMTALNSDATRRWKADFGNYFPLFSRDASLATSLGKVLTFHSYWSDDAKGKLVQDREILGKALAAHPGWKLWQSEYCVMEGGRDLGMDTALRVARVIHQDLTVVGVSSWQWWLAVSNGDYKDGLIYTDFRKPGDEEYIHESKTLWAFGNFSRFIRPGMIRVELRHGPQELEGMMTSAYLDAANRRIVVVAVHLGDKPRSVKFAITRGDSPGKANLRFRPYVTDSSNNLSAQPLFDSANSFEVPARSVVTFVSEP